MPNLNNISRNMEIVGINSPSSNSGYGWFRGTAHDYYIRLPDGKIVAEVTMRPSQFRNEGDTIYGVTLDIDKAEPTKPLQVEFYGTRTAGRNRVEDFYAGTPSQ